MTPMTPCYLDVAGRGGQDYRNSEVIGSYGNRVAQLYFGCMLTGIPSSAMIDMGIFYKNLYHTLSYNTNVYKKNEATN